MERYSNEGIMSAGWLLAKQNGRLFIRHRNYFPARFSDRGREMETKKRTQKIPHTVC